MLSPNARILIRAKVDDQSKDTRGTIATASGTLQQLNQVHVTTFIAAFETRGTDHRVKIGCSVRTTFISFTYINSAARSLINPLSTEPTCCGPNLGKHGPTTWNGGNGAGIPRCRGFGPARPSHAPKFGAGRTFPLPALLERGRYAKRLALQSDTRDSRYIKQYLFLSTIFSVVPNHPNCLN
jgi:hypothetical protein